MSTCDFPANSVISSFSSTEAMLVDFLGVVPYCPEHEIVWSPRLVTILLEACSQLDSLWRSQALVDGLVDNPQQSNNLNITHYFDYFADVMAPRWVIFWGAQRRIRPFELWENARLTDHNASVSTEWWGAYNDVKHNRLSNEQKATLKNAVEAVGALFLAIVKCSHCWDAIAAANWIFRGLADYYGPQRHLAESACSGTDSSQDADRLAYVTVESKLFTYPVCLGAEPEPQDYLWIGHCSNRFMAWIDSQANSSS